MFAKLTLAAFGLSTWVNTCTQSEKTQPRTELLPADTVRLPPVDFIKDIQPILQSHCTPCHFEGGKMYATMPFDKPQTLSDHREGILRRIKGPEEVKKLKVFLDNTPE